MNADQIRIIAGVLFCIILALLVWRRKSKSV